MDDFHKLDDEDVDVLPDLKIVRRGKWGAVPPKIKEPIKLPAHRVFFTTTNTYRCMTKEECMKSMKEMQQYYMEEKGMPDIPFSFLIGGDLRIYEGRGWGVKIREAAEPMEQPSWKTGRVVIGFITKGDEMTPPSSKTRRKYWSRYKDTYKIQDTNNSTHMQKMIDKGFSFIQYGARRNYMLDFEQHQPGQTINLDDESELRKVGEQIANEPEKAPGFEKEDEELSPDGSSYVSSPDDKIEMTDEDLKPAKGDIFLEMQEEREKRRKKWEKLMKFEDPEEHEYRSSSDDDEKKPRKNKNVKRKIKVRDKRFKNNSRSEDSVDSSNQKTNEEIEGNNHKHGKQKKNDKHGKKLKEKKPATKRKDPRTVLDEMNSMVKELERCKNEVGDYSPNDSDDDYFRSSLNDINIDSLQFPYDDSNEVNNSNFEKYIDKTYRKGDENSRNERQNTKENYISEEDRTKEEEEEEVYPDQETVLKKMWAEQKELERCKIEIGEDSPNDTDDDYYRSFYNEKYKRTKPEFKNLGEILDNSL